MNLPNFLIIGAQKCGTSSLYQYLKQHPQIYMSRIKEPQFLAIEGEPYLPRAKGSGGLARIQGIRDFETYCQQFQGVSDEIAIGEASALYIYVPKTIERIKHYIPDAKIIAILRQPVDRAYSHYLNWVQRNLETFNADFIKLFQEEETRIRNDWSPSYHYKTRGFYYAQLKPYFENFRQEQFKIYLYDELRDNPVKLVQDILKFLNVDETFMPDFSEQYNVSQIPKNKTLYQLVKKSNPLKSLFKPFFPASIRQNLKKDFLQKNTVKPKLAPEIRQQLTEVYREDILNLQDLIQKDLSKWLN